MALKTVDLLPLVVNKDIENAYVKLGSADVLYNLYETSRILTLSGATLTTSVSAFIATETGSLSSYWNVLRLHAYNRNMEDATTSITGGFGVCSIRKVAVDTKIKPGTLTATCSGSLSGDYYDSGSGAIIFNTDGSTVGAMYNDDGMFMITGTSSAMVQSISSVKYKASVINTSLNVFCKCAPDEQNFSLNPTSLEAIGDWMTDPFTASTSSSTLRYDFTKSGIAWAPLITNVGLYDDNNNLLAIAKFARPLRKPTDVPLTFHLRIDL